MDIKQKQPETHALDQILPAILAVQSSVEPIKKDTDNPFFKSKYADLASIWHEIKGFMKEQDLVVIHAARRSDEGGDNLITRIYHTSSGQYIESVCPIEPVKKDPQGYGAAMTYMRRYALSGLLGIVTEADDDGNVASQAKPKPKETPKLKEDIIVDFTQEEYELINKSIKDSCVIGDLDAVAENARAAWPRMSKTYRDLVSKAISNKKAGLARGAP